MTNRIAPLALVALAGCTTAMELGRAETLARGDWELGGALGFSTHYDEREAPHGEPDRGVLILIPVLPFDVWAAYGVADRLEVSARVGTLSAQLGLKGGLIRTPDFSLALAGGVSADAYGRFLDGGALRSRLALIAGARLPARLELDLAPQCAWPLDPARWRPELLGATASAYYHTVGRGRVGLAVTWLRYRATAPEPGETSRADYLGLALVVGGRRGAGDE